MTQILNVDTGGTIIMGPFVSEADGTSLLTDLDLTPAGTIKISQPNGTVMDRQSSVAPDDVTGLPGYYSVNFNSLDAQLMHQSGHGSSSRAFVQVAGALPVWVDLQVMSDAGHSLLYGTSVYGVDANIVSIGHNAVSNDDARAAAIQLREQFNPNGGGILKGHYPARQDQIDSLEAIIGGASRAAVVESALDEITSGGASGGGGWEATHIRDGEEGSPTSAYAIVTASSAGARWWGFKSQITSDSEAVRLHCHFHIASSGNEWHVQAVDWTLYDGTGGADPDQSDWETLGVIGATSDKDQSLVVPMFARHTNSNTTEFPHGTVMVRLWQDGTDEAVEVDQMYFEYNTVVRSVGYDGGAIWIDTVNGSNGTLPYINGTADNPCKTLAEALTLSGSTFTNLNRFHVAIDSVLDMNEGGSPQNLVGKVVEGIGYELVMHESADLHRCNIIGATVSGKMNPTSNAGVQFKDCILQNDAEFVAPAALINCTLVNDVRLIEEGEYTFEECLSETIDATNLSYGTIIVDESGNTSADGVKIGLRDCMGQFEIVGLKDYGGGNRVDSLVAEVTGHVKIKDDAGTNHGGLVLLAGIHTRDLTEATGITVVDPARVESQRISNIVWDRVYIDDDNGVDSTTGMAGTIEMPVDSITNAKTIADREGINAFSLARNTSIALNTGTPGASAYNGWSFYGTGNVDVTGQDVLDCYFESVSVTGIGNSQSVSQRSRFFRATINGPFEGVPMICDECAFTGTTKLYGTPVINNCYSGSAAGATFDCSALSLVATYDILGWGGKLILSSSPNGSGHAYDVSFRYGEFDHFQMESTGNITISGACSNILPGSLSTQPIVDLRTALEPTSQLILNDTTDLIGATIRNLGVAEAGAASTITLDEDSSPSARDDEYIGSYIVLTGGTGAGQQREITDYVGASRLATITPNWTANPDATTEYIVLTHQAAAGGGGGGDATEQNQLDILAAIGDRAPVITGGTDTLFGNQLAMAGVGFTAGDALKPIHDLVDLIPSLPADVWAHDISGSSASVLLQAAASGSSLTPAEIWEHDISSVTGPGLAGTQLNTAAAGGGGGATPQEIWEHDISAITDPNLAGTQLNSAALAASPTDVDTSLAAIHLDRLLAVDLGDQVISENSLFGSMAEFIAGGLPYWRYKDTALEQAPSGSGGGSTAEEIWDFISLRTGQIVSAVGNTQLELDGDAITSDYYNGTWIQLMSGGGAGQVRLITQTNPGGFGTHDIVVEPGFVTEPRGGDDYRILPAAYIYDVFVGGNGGGGDATAENQDQIMKMIGSSIAGDNDTNSLRGMLDAMASKTAPPPAPALFTGSFSPDEDSLEAATDRIVTTNTYWADIDLNVDPAGSGGDEYTVTWYRNGAPADGAAITFPKIRVIKREDGEDYVAETDMAQVGTLGTYKYDEGINVIMPGESVIVEVKATIDGAERINRQAKGRDSAAP